MSGWIIFTICFNTLLVGTWAAVTVYEFYRADKRMKEAETQRRAARVLAGRRGPGL